MSKAAKVRTREYESEDAHISVGGHVVEITAEAREQLRDEMESEHLAGMISDISAAANRSLLNEVRAIKQRHGLPILAADLHPRTEEQMRDEATMDAASHDRNIADLQAKRGSTPAPSAKPAAPAKAAPEEAPPSAGLISDFEELLAADGPGGNLALALLRKAGYPGREGYKVATNDELLQIIGRVYEKHPKPEEGFESGSTVAVKHGAMKVAELEEPEQPAEPTPDEVAAAAAELADVPGNTILPQEAEEAAYRQQLEGMGMPAIRELRQAANLPRSRTKATLIDSLVEWRFMPEAEAVPAKAVARPEGGFDVTVDAGALDAAGGSVVIDIEPAPITEKTRWMCVDLERGWCGKNHQHVDSASDHVRKGGVVLRIELPGARSKMEARDRAIREAGELPPDERPRTDDHEHVWYLPTPGARKAGCTHKTCSATAELAAIRDTDRAIIEGGTAEDSEALREEVHGFLALYKSLGEDPYDAIGDLIDKYPQFDEDEARAIISEWLQGYYIEGSAKAAAGSPGAPQLPEGHSRWTVRNLEVLDKADLLKLDFAKGYEGSTKADLLKHILAAQREA